MKVFALLMHAYFLLKNTPKLSVFLHVLTKHSMFLGLEDLLFGSSFIILASSNHVTTEGDKTKTNYQSKQHAKDKQTFTTPRIAESD